MGMDRVTRKTQKDLERFYLESFLDVGGMVTNGIHEGEPPDFLIEMDGVSVGVEVTEHDSSAKGARGLPRRAVEEEWKHLVTLLREMRKEYPDLDKVSGWLCFWALDVPPRREHRAFLRELLDFTVSQRNEITRKRSRFSDFGAECPRLRQYLREVHLTEVECYITWDCNHSAANVGVSESELLVTVGPKLGESFADSASEHWLLVVSGNELSQAMGWAHVDTLNAYSQLNEEIDRGPFKRVTCSSTCMIGSSSSLVERRGQRCALRPLCDEGLRSTSR